MAYVGQRHILGFGSLRLFVPCSASRFCQGIVVHPSWLSDYYGLSALEAMDFDSCRKQVSEETHVLARMNFDLQRLSWIPRTISARVEIKVI